MRSRTAAAAAIAVLALAGCSTGHDAAANATEIAFAQAMIPHHEQAVQMAELALAADSSASNQVQELAREIKAAQDPEVEQMAGWLQEWGAPTQMPGASGAAGMDDMDHGGHDMGAMTMSGMMTAQDMAELAASDGEQFDRMWLTMMIQHHEGAVDMAEQVEDASADTEVTALAEQIIAAQQQEITTMQQLLAQ